MAMTERRGEIGPDKFLPLAIRRLGEFPDLDYAKTWSTIQAGKAKDGNRRAAGVLLLFGCQERMDGDIFVYLIKRSRRVSQGGDISCPGGMLAPRLDSFIKVLIDFYFLPVMTGQPRRYARRRGKETFNLITLFLGNALRETWEEVGLSPWSVKFLGPLPTYSLYTLERTIFPLVGWIRKPWSARPSKEVDKVFKVPLEAFFAQGNYAHFSITSDYDTSYHQELPAFIVRDEDGNQEILWGATFNIVTRFLKLVFDFSLPEISKEASFHRILTPEYITGNKDL